MVPGSLGWGRSVLAATAILAPSAAALSAMARPMPREAPEMNRVLPCREDVMMIGSTLVIESAYPNEFADRSEEHTSELQSRGHLVCRLLLEKKKNKDK